MTHRHGRAVINLDCYIPYPLVTITNTLSRGASQRYLADFGVGIVEWRVLSTLAIEPNSSAARICEIIMLDKAATSRSLSRLDELGYLSFEARPSNPRAKSWRLNRAGDALHDQILEIALERERALIEGVDASDLEIFLKVMRQMRDNLDIARPTMSQRG